MRSRLVALTALPLTVALLSSTPAAADDDRAPAPPFPVVSELVSSNSSRCVAVSGASAGDVAVVNITNTQVAGRGWGALRGSGAVPVYEREVDDQYSSVNFDAGTPPNPNLAVVEIGEDGEFCYDNGVSASNVILDLAAVIPAANVVAVEPSRLLDTRTETDPGEWGRLPWNPAAGFADPAAAAAGFMRWVEDAASFDVDQWTPEPPEVAPDGSSATVEVRFTDPVFDVVLNRLVQPVTTVEMVRDDGAWYAARAVSPSIAVDQPLDFFEVPISVDFVNALISSGIELRFYADGASDPFIDARFRGGGIFAAGEFSAVIDPVTCVERNGAFDIVTCTGPPPPNVGVTLVITTNHAVSTHR